MIIRFTCRLVATLAALLAGAPVHAQSPLQVPGEPAIVAKAVEAPRLRLPASAPHAFRVRLPEVTEAEVESVREANRERSTKGPRAVNRRVVVGLVRATPAGEMPQAQEIEWTPVAGGHAAQVAVTSPEAGSLRLALELAGVPLEVEMVFRGSARDGRLEGPVRVGDIADRTGRWWSPLTEGETQVVEFFVPARIDPATVAPRVIDVSHVFTTPSSRFTKRLEDIGDAESCNVDIACSNLNSSTAFRNAVDSVAQMVFIEGGRTVLCTGTLLADADTATQAPWFWSANHCFENDAAPYKTPAQMQSVANTLSTIWFFEASDCRSGTPVSNWTQRSGGATWIYSNPRTDVLFLRLNSPPPSGAWFSGWDANPLPGSSSVIAIHHPMGDLKKVTQGNFVGYAVPGVAGGSESFAEVRWTLGSTDVGSSGGGLWTTSGGQYLFRGGLWGGNAFCSVPTGSDYYSRLDQAYPAIAGYIAASASPAYDVTDLWWGGESESGWGLNLTQHPSRIVFGVWYTYGSDGKRTWFVIPTGTWTSSTTYVGPIYETEGPRFSGTFNPALVSARHVGNATLSFTNSGNGTFTFTVDGVQGSKAITRQPF